jgi:hypothetical protein
VPEQFLLAAAANQNAAVCLMQAVQRAQVLLAQAEHTARKITQ